MNENAAGASALVTVCAEPGPSMTLAAERVPQTGHGGIGRHDEVLAIVVTHNGLPWLKECLSALDNQSHPAVEIMVVDDCSSTEDQGQRLERIVEHHIAKRRYSFLRTPRVLGYGAAINWALSQKSIHAGLLLFVHDDAKLDETAVESLVKRMRAAPLNAIVGPKIVSWDDPSRLQEVGLSTDRFGFPYKGLEEDEMDSGQRDDAREVFHVTSTCMLVRQDVFRRLLGWDAGMGAFAEDLDLCWRARIAGWSVVVEPRARARHVMALAAGARKSPYGPARYYARRNRMRALVKNVSTPRLFTLLPALLLMTIAETVGFVALGRLSAAGSVLRALGWNFVTLPKTLHVRARAQRLRRVPDGALKGLTVPSSFRVRSYLNRELGPRSVSRAEDSGSAAGSAAAAGRPLRLLRPRAWLVALLVILAAALALRSFLFAPQVAAGELLPFPAGATTLWSAWWEAWKPGAGAVSPGPALLGVFSVLALGSGAAAQKLMIVLLAAIAAIGAYRLVAPFAPVQGGYVAAAAYAAGPVGLVGLRTGSLGALVFGAAAPFVIGALLGVLGWRPVKSRARSFARIALGGAASGAFVPGSLILYAGVAVLASVAAVLLPPQVHGEGGKERPRRRRPSVVRGVWRGLTGLGWSLAALAASWMLLLPWSLTWLERGGALQELVGDTTWRSYAGAWAGHGSAETLIGMPSLEARLFGVGVALLGTASIFVCRGHDRSLALLLWAMAAASGGLASATAAGVLRPVVPSPTAAGVMASLALGACAGLGAGGLWNRLISPGSKVARLVAGLTFAASGVLALAGLVPGVVSGAWAPQPQFQAAAPSTLQRVAEAIAGAASAGPQNRPGAASAGPQDRPGAASAGPQNRPGAASAGPQNRPGAASEPGSLEVLWPYGRPPSSSRSPAVPDTPHLVTGLMGPSIADLLETDRGRQDRLERAVATIESGATDAGGELLASSGVELVVVDRARGAGRWLEQLDLALVRTDPDFLLFENRADLPQADPDRGGLQAAVKVAAATRAAAVAVALLCAWLLTAGRRDRRTEAARR